MRVDGFERITRQTVSEKRYFGFGSGNGKRGTLQSTHASVVQ